MKQRSPLVSMRYPAIEKVVLEYNETTIWQRTDSQHSRTVPGVPPRCSPTTQQCIFGNCKWCAGPRLRATQAFYRTRSQLKKTGDLMKVAQLEGVQIPKDVLGWLRGLKFDAYVIGHEKTIDMPVTMMQVLPLRLRVRLMAAVCCWASSSCPRV